MKHQFMKILIPLVNFLPKKRYLKIFIKFFFKDWIRDNISDRMLRAQVDARATEIKVSKNNENFLF